MAYPTLDLRKTLDSLPPIYASSSDLRSQIRTSLNNGSAIPLLVVLDDDPTGTQT